jgi:hypothetical protein
MRQAEAALALRGFRVRVLGPVGVWRERGGGGGRWGVKKKRPAEGERGEGEEKRGRGAEGYLWHSACEFFLSIC